MLYPMIWKRKSFHRFQEIGHISEEELREVEAAFLGCKPLIPEIRVELKIVPGEKTTCRRGQEYCCLLYSERKEGYLTNIGYLGEQLDLILASRNIGALWFGIGKTEERGSDGLDFVIMIAIAKMPKDKFRKDMFKSKRKPLEEIWNGEDYREIGNIVRFAPSACNTQPWKVEAAANELKISRYKKPGKRGIMPADKVAYYNRIDIGIFLFFIETCLEHAQIDFEREIYSDIADDVSEEVPVAEYKLN